MRGNRKKKSNIILNTTAKNSLEYDCNTLKYNCKNKDLFSMTTKNSFKYDCKIVFFITFDQI